MNDPRARNISLDEITIRNLEVKYGLDKPWPEQLSLYLRNVARFEFGDSYAHQGQSVRGLILRNWISSFALGVIVFAIVLVAATGLGILAALRQGSFVDYVVIGLATFGASVPNFVIGILLILSLSVGLNRLTGGAFSFPSGGFGMDEHLVLPVMTMSLLPVAFIARLVRSSTLEVMRQDYVRTAAAKGASERWILIRHVLKNSLIPVVTALGPLFAYLISGSVVVESVFQIPGIGGLFVNGVNSRDYPVIIGTVVVFALVIAAANLVVDLVYSLVDPRVRPS
ncbi:MAG: ABC transporter permease [Actinomycetota bacterium]|nr:ABC transporter permease [Actinomycetota bacterium]